MHSSVVVVTSHYNRSCYLSPLLLIPLLPPPSTSSSSSIDRTHHHCFSLPNRTLSYCSTHLPSLPYTFLIAPSHALLYAALALSRYLLCHSRLPLVPLCLRGR
ncbi:hypothetical protein B296_00002325 [Ensete ventricosum]|uniref:Uncharacterized protein n=1 Tax=Ensete ventricosum TaxID=4639 RepID=A0A426ZES9_ENSVE|nr:hypothetical protein B296_00002325 [Ensete ventricosum]